MRRFSLLVVGLLALPALASAQLANCPECVIGLWDDINLNANHGNVTPGAVKEIYLGVNFEGAPAETGVTGLEFSLYGMRTAEDGILITGVDGVTDPLPNIILPNGSFAAPADTTATTTGTGGGNIGWQTCAAVTGKRALVKVSFIAFAPLPQNKVLRVLKRFPPNNPNIPTQLFTRCDNPTFTLTSTQGGCYVINWDGVTGTVDGCVVTTSVREGTWSGMKSLYR